VSVESKINAFVPEDKPEFVPSYAVFKSTKELEPSVPVERLPNALLLTSSLSVPLTKSKMVSPEALAEEAVTLLPTVPPALQS